MSKARLVDPKIPKGNEKGQGKSIFFLTFAVEIISNAEWEDSPEDGWINVGNPIQGCKLAYTLYPGYSFEVELLIWAQFAKVQFNGPQPQHSCMVRTWMHEKRRFLAFSIRHIFTVRVHELLEFTANVTPSFGLNSVGGALKSTKLATVFLCPAPFGFKQYFGEVINPEIESIEDYITDLIWEYVEPYIPVSLTDGQYNIPKPVSDVRHRDTIFNSVQELALQLNEDKPDKKRTTEAGKAIAPAAVVKGKDKKQKGTASEAKSTNKYILKLSGMEILAGAGRMIKFETFGDRSPETGEVIVLLSTSNLPAEDDYPIVFININELMQVPAQTFKKLRITEIYTRWTLENHTHESERETFRIETEVIKFRDHFVIPLELENGSRILASFWDMPFKIEIRGVREAQVEQNTPTLFGYDKTDKFISEPVKTIPSLSEDTDVPIALCTVDLRSLAKGMNGLVRGEYFVNPMPDEIPKLQREEVCTNDINAIRRRIPVKVVPNSVILEAQMTLSVELGQVGCKLPKITNSFSRLYCLSDDTISVKTIFLYIAELNEGTAHSKERNKLLTGFAVDLGNKVFLVLEGPRDGNILHVWERCIDIYKTMKPVFNSSSRFTERLYPELEAATVPFIIMKMHASLSSILACPAVYVNPTTPLPARTALLKLGRLFYTSLTDQPSRLDLPTFNDLRSFRLEFCAPPKPMSGSEYIAYSKGDIIALAPQCELDCFDLEYYKHCKPTRQRSDLISELRPKKLKQSGISDTVGAYISLTN